jgi:hypothetical protein
MLNIKSEYKKEKSFVLFCFVVFIDFALGSKFKIQFYFFHSSPLFKNSSSSSESESPHSFFLSFLGTADADAVAVFLGLNSSGGRRGAGADGHDKGLVGRR